MGFATGNDAVNLPLFNSPTGRAARAKSQHGWLQTVPPVFYMGTAAAFLITTIVFGGFLMSAYGNNANLQHGLNRIASQLKPVEELLALDREPDDEPTSENDVLQQRLNKVSSLMEQYKVLQNYSHDMHVQVAKAHEEGKSQQATRAELERRIGYLEESGKTMEESKKAMEESIGSLEEANNALMSQNTQLQVEIDAHKARIGEHADEHQRQLVAIKNLEAMVTTVQAENSNLVKQMQKLENAEIACKRNQTSLVTSVLRTTEGFRKQVIEKLSSERDELMIILNRSVPEFDDGDGNDDDDDDDDDNDDDDGDEDEDEDEDEDDEDGDDGDDDDSDDGDEDNEEGETTRGRSVEMNEAYGMSNNYKVSTSEPQGEKGAADIENMDTSVGQRDAQVYSNHWN